MTSFGLLQAFLFTVLVSPQRVDFGTCALAGGGAIEDCHVNYQWFGSPNPDGSNVIIVPTWFCGSAEAAGQLMTQDGLTDNGRHALLVIDAFGNGVSSSPSNSATQAGLRFPRVSISDMVNWQYRLAHQVLGLPRVEAVMGISMGGMQALQWAVSFPAFMGSVVNIVGTPTPTAADVALWGPKIAALETLARLGQVRHADAALQLRAMREQNLTARQSVTEVASRVKARTLMILDRNDYFLRPGPSIELANALRSEVHISRSACGHLSPLLCDRGPTMLMVSAFLEERPAHTQQEAFAPSNAECVNQF